MFSFPPTERDDDWPIGYALDRFDALLFDLDGTLVDTMPLHGRAYSDVFARRGHHFTMADYTANVGPPARIAVPAFAAAAGMGDIDESLVNMLHREKKTRFKEILSDQQAPTLPASKLLLRYHGIKKLALVSSGNRDGVQAILETMGWRNYFDTVISGDDCTNGKPHPDPYLIAARAMNVAPDLSMVFEDTSSGIEAARAAGMSVIDVTKPGAVYLASAAQ